jgi:galactose-1-phosphate uridylyltransferase
MLEDLEKYLKNVKKIDLKKLEKTIRCFVIEPSGQSKASEIKIRSNPAFHSESRIAPEREARKIETTSVGFKTPSIECFFCNPNKCASFSKETGLKKQYFLNDSVAFSNLFPFGKIHGIVVHNYKQHITDPRSLILNNWIDSIKLVQEIGKISKKKYVSMHVNCGSKAASSLEHFHAQFHCEDEPLAKTALAVKLGNRKYWKSWVKTLYEEGLVIGFDKESKVVFFVEWSPAFGKTEFVVMTLENSSFQKMNDKEINAVARFIDKAIRITIDRISDQFNIINLSAAPKDNFCNQFRIFSRAPLSHGTKSWEGYLEFSGETVPHIIPERLAELAKEY